MAGERHGSELKIDSLHPVVLQIIFHKVGMFHLAFSWLLRIRATAQIFLTATHTTNVIHPSKCKVVYAYDQMNHVVEVPVFFH